jgi:hypothetical protein
MSESKTNKVTSAGEENWAKKEKKF